MRRNRSPYPAEFREHIVTLHRSGRSIASLAREFEPNEPTILSWVRAASASTSGSVSSGELELTEREELLRLRREVATLKMAAASSIRDSSFGSRKPVHLH